MKGPVEGEGGVGRVDGGGDCLEKEVIDLHLLCHELER